MSFMFYAKEVYFGTFSRIGTWTDSGTWEFDIRKEPNTNFGGKDKMLRNKVIPLIKVLWQKYKVGEATWEQEDEMRIKYPHLF